jgi:hypothetical protein
MARCMSGRAMRIDAVPLSAVMVLLDLKTMV